MRTRRSCWQGRTSAAGRAESTRLGRCWTTAFAPLSHRALPTFFTTNCFKNGVLPVVLDAGTVDALFVEVERSVGFSLTIDLNSRTVTTPSGASHRFEVDDFRRDCLLNGLDEVGLTLQHREEVKAYERRRRKEAPWLFVDQ